MRMGLIVINNKKAHLHSKSHTYMLVRHLPFSSTVIAPPRAQRLNGFWIVNPHSCSTLWNVYISCARAVNASPRGASSRCGDVSSVPVRSDDEATCGAALLESKARLRSLVVQSFLTFIPSPAQFRSAVLMLLLSAVLFSLVTF